MEELKCFWCGEPIAEQDLDQDTTEVEGVIQDSFPFHKDCRPVVEPCS